ncbi:MAG: bifunctional diaminohydroxyphosphoribosylaminopyrimidine deaminase/5-amino-6-(5-phosphoribosylamino)uracil reductase RibD [Planctomycetota bacterium]
MTDDEKFMGFALRAALRGVGRTCPNPAVGAVVVREGDVVAVGHHAHAGAPHAETEALRAAGTKAQGATLFVTLEPCCHTGRTPPCCDGILDAGVKEVVFALVDPSPHCAGDGEAALKSAGLAVRRNVCEAEARTLNGPFLKRVEKGLPFVTAKWAMTLDGKTATRTGDSRWISSPPARAYAHRLRSRAGAVLVGAGTARRDDPLLTCRLPGRRQPVRVVADARARLGPESQLAHSANDSPVLVAHAAQAPASRLDVLRRQGIRTLEVAETPEGIDLEGLLRELAAGVSGLPVVDHVLLEGGGELAASAWTAALVDRVAAVIAPKVLGGVDSKSPAGGKGIEVMESAFPLLFRSVRRLGPDILVEGIPRPESEREKIGL